MGWCTTTDLDQFASAAGGYLRSRAAENSLLLSAAQALRFGWRAQVIGLPSGPGVAGGGAGVLFGWWAPPDGSGPRGAFLHDPAVPLLIAGRIPELAAALAGTLAKMGRHVGGVDAPIEAADAFSAAWSQRAHTSIRVHRQCRVYRLTPAPDPGTAPAGPAASAGQGGALGAWPPPGMPGTPGVQGVGAQGPSGRLRVATPADRVLLIDWLIAFAAEAGERIGSPGDMADDLISYGGAVFWEIPQRTSRIKEAGKYLVNPLVNPQRRDAAQQAELACQPVAMAALTRPVARTVRISMVYTLPERRRNGHAATIMLAASRAVLAGTAPACESGTEPGVGSEVVFVADGNRPDRRVTRLGYQLVGERVVLRFGPPTGTQPTLRATGPMPRLPTGPMPRLPTGPMPRLRRWH